MLENYRMTGKYTLETEVSQIFGSVAKEWADSKLFRDLKYSTQKDYRSSMNTHILPYFGDMPIEDIRYKNVTDFIETLSCSSKRINNILVPMRSVFKKAHKEEMLEKNIMLLVDNMTVEKTDIHPFTHGEVLKILDTINPFYRNYTAVRFYTGARSGELDGLKWGDFKLNMKPTPKLYINKTLVCGFEGKPKNPKGILIAFHRY